jgi:hypothetical protein
LRKNSKRKKPLSGNNAVFSAKNLKKHGLNGIFCICRIYHLILGNIYSLKTDVFSADEHKDNAARFECDYS